MSRTERSLWGFGLAVLALHVAGAFMAGPNAWGFHHYAFLPQALLWVAAGAALLFCLPPVAGALAPAVRRLESPGAARAAAAVTIVLLAVVYFLLRTRSFLLSDSMLLIRSVNQGFVNFAADTLAAVIQLWFHYGLAQLFGVTSWTASFRIISIACGVIWLAAAFATVGRLVKDGGGRFILAGLLATAGITKLFFGYAETGPLLAAAIGVYIWSAVRLVQDGKGILAATLSFLVVAAMHVTGLLLFPSYLFLLVAWSGGDMKRLGRALPLLLLPVAAYMLFWFSQGGTLERVWNSYRPYFAEFIPLAGPLDAKQPFTLFSLPRLTEFLNEQLFIGPFALLALGVLLLTRFRGDPGSAAPRRFFLWALLPFLLLSIVFNRKLGGARDWDLLANLAVPALYLVGIALLEARKKPVLSGAGLALVAVSAFHLVGIVLVDARPVSAIRNFIVLAEPEAPVSRFARSYALEEVGQHYVDTGNGDLALPFFEEAANVDPGNIRAVGTLGTMYMALGRGDEAMPLLREAVRQRPELAMTHYNLAAALAAAGQWEEAAAEFREAVRGNPDLLPGWTGWGTSENQLNRPAVADSVAGAGLARFPGDPDLLLIRGGALERMGRREEALTVYNTILETSPDNAQALFNASRIELESEKFEVAAGHLERLIHLTPGDAEAVVNLGIAYASLQRMDEAIEAFNKAITIDPVLPQPYINLATIHQQKGDLHAAADVLEAFARADSASARILNLSRVIDQFRATGSRQGAP